MIGIIRPAESLARKLIDFVRSNPPQPFSRRVAFWLLTGCALLATLVVVGGATRLTHSGLSIPEWKPISGTLPPLSEAEWNELFASYRETPEYRHTNLGMSLAEFRTIFWWEYSHRLLARLFGLFLLLPLLFLALERRLDRALGWKLAGIVALVGAQGALGWWMVASGLIDNPRVSHLRLTAHLGLAFVIFAALFWLALSQLEGSAPRRGATGLELRLARATAALVFLQLLSGGLVAGSRAGAVCNTFPTMWGHLVPPGLWTLAPGYRNLFWNLVTLQFSHRMLAWGLVTMVALLLWRLRGAGTAGALRRASAALAAALLVQFGLGVATLVLGVPIALAIAHQAGAVLLFAAALATAHAARPSAREPAMP